MKKILKKFADLFSPKELQGLDSLELLDALNDAAIRKEWLWEVYEELKRLNLKVDASLRDGTVLNLRDLCARRRAYQDMLEAVLSAKRQIRSNNPAQAEAAWPA